MNLSIIIPVFNEAEKIRDDILMISKFLNENKLTGEIIISDDGSTDDTIIMATETPVSELVQLSVISDGKHVGKGHAVRKGILQSKGNIVLFMDSGKTVKLDAITKGLEMIQHGDCQIVLGSRHLPESIINIPLTFHRRVVSVLFRLFIKLVFPSMWGFTDTQCGFKISNGNLARKIYGESVIDGFLFDIEFLKKAKKNAVTIYELPIHWTCDRDSRLSLLPTLWEVLRDALRLIIH
ncbi:MAG: glycosyltransferase [Candidatus Marinimicrobia bacterium]|jgi:dolichyl-phosphate beta-glucosyltransferase|nr:hypothetical protein [Acidiferrobacteraceae bacterium]MDP6032890.1 glycosyltransferase [Candidatus Neomarinimicrobiota bacterium]|tara:strand:- start:12643 stop:13353 length:711 start_codon:yes stop_codon:yes gene_type:complete